MMANEVAASAGPNRSRYAVDLLERVLAAAAEGGIGVVTVQLANWPTWISVPIAAGAAVVKGWLARYVGSSNSASLAPRV